MATINIMYNPYTVQTIIEVDGIDFMQQGKLSQYKNERLQVWIDELVRVLVEEINEDELNISFKGTLLDFEDLAEVCNQFKNYHAGVHIHVEHIQGKESSDKIMELEGLVNHMFAGPFNVLKDPKIKQNFEKAMNSEFEIAVIATMSSGKSTLINAFLGQELMPSKNEACTAKIARIKNDDNCTRFSAVCYDKDGKELVSKQNLSYVDMDSFNDNREISIIDIKGRIPSMSSEKMNLVLVDTPGPNNSMDTSHRDHTHRVIKNDDKPMVLYVLNATQLKTDDDYALLKTVAEAMKVGGKQSKDRFIFAVNKADCFDPDKGEDLANVLHNVKDYLEKHGIENPNIYPISAETAKVIRKYNSGQDLTRQENKTLRNIDLFIEEPSMHLTNYAPLSPSLKNKISDKIMMARDEHDEELEALYHSGVPAVEMAINEYLDKYAVTSKITNAVNSFKKIVEREQMMQNLQQRMADDQEEKDRVHQEMSRIEQELEQGEKAKVFRQRIKNLDFNIESYFENSKEKIFNQELQAISDRFRNEKVRKHEADMILYKARKDVDMLQSSAVTDLEKLIGGLLKENAKKYIDEYRKYIKNIMDFQENSLAEMDNIKLFSYDLPDVDDLINNYSYEEEELVGTKTVYNDNKKWYKPWTWFDDEYYEKDVYETREYVNMSELKEEFLNPVRYSLEENFYQAQQYSENEKEKLKRYFISEIDRLELLMKKRVEEIKNLSSRSSKIEEELMKNEEKKIWLNEFIIRLDKVLEV
ncbi:dynamin family protein [Bacillus sp. S/N-304-OC-R1]|uniref:dynamin family protein n=1 Tax=Bacillus sp. S/N-304-OC-R1 TaxID=2758034 RepID=UPI001C8D12F8|nr:dynamin family protein [Bacillus sp. S/N-304-OC-R1]MBY0124392.1 dynamin family protein [Bacillus sp. S/N-304-OC-R1]